MKNMVKNTKFRTYGGENTQCKPTNVNILDLGIGFDQCRVLINKNVE